VTGLVVDLAGLDGHGAYERATHVQFIGNDYGVDAINIGTVRGKATIRKSYAHALLDMMMLGIGHWDPGPYTVETAPEFECWAHRNEGR
jgi:hypothetical protein